IGANGEAACCVYLMRHAQTYGNSKGVLNGVRNDLGLTKKGAMQAKRAAAALTIRPEIILCSPQRRAIETAAQIAKNTGARIEIVKELHEQDCGDWTGKSIASLQKRYPSYFVKYKQRLTRIFSSSPNGETIGQMQKRARKVISLISKKYKSRPLMVVTHGVVIRVFLYELGLVGSIGEAMAKRVPNCSIVRIAF
ncbi:MAG TPA: histidine phosphatase family protein, partial [Candidatus Micrarchaeota archaeon]|nr:histidine phosphatase family protein [Candidatus Micrarchaeota archaeon]